mgnify:CR=1 FL=1
MDHNRVGEVVDTRARYLIQQVLLLHQSMTQQFPQAIQIGLIRPAFTTTTTSRSVAQQELDDWMALANKWVACHQDFGRRQQQIPNNNNNASIVYHYTQERYLHESIRFSGLLSQQERRDHGMRPMQQQQPQQQQPQPTRQEWAHFGNGIYTSGNPFAYAHFGDTGLLVACIRGREQRVDNGTTAETTTSNVNTITGNKFAGTDEGDSYSDEIVFQESRQLLPLIQFRASSVVLDGPQHQLLWAYHVHIQKILDACFNHGVATPLVPFYPPERRLRDLQRSSQLTTAPTTQPIINRGRPSTAGTPILQGTTTAATQTHDAGGSSHILPLATSTNVHGCATVCAMEAMRPQQQIHPISALPHILPTTGISANGSAAGYAMGAARSPPQPQQIHSASALLPLQQLLLRNNTHHRLGKLPRIETIPYIAPTALATDMISDCVVPITDETLPASTSECLICWNGMDPKEGGTARVVKLKACSLVYHQDCLEISLKFDPRCPQCRMPLRLPQGKCPSGIMSVRHITMACAGYEDYHNNIGGTIVIRYSMPSGRQCAYHETPGQVHEGTVRETYLPNIAEGRKLYLRLKYAWQRGLLFTIGTSLTTGKLGQIVWSSVHQKTSLGQHPRGRGHCCRNNPHGYPDPNYFVNCNQELDALLVPSAQDCMQLLGADNSFLNELTAIAYGRK